MDNTKNIRADINNLLEELWDKGYEIGKNDQWNEDEIKLEEEKTTSYDSGYDDGYNDGYKQGLEDGKKEVSE